MQVLKTLHINLSDDPAIALLGAYPPQKKTKTKTKPNIHTKPSMWMLKAALFIITKNWKQSKCPPVDEGINTTSIPHNGMLFRNKKGWNTDTWIKPKNIMLRKNKNHTQRTMYSMIQFTWTVLKRPIYKDRK